MQESPKTLLRKIYKLVKEREKQLLKEIEKGKEIQDLFTYATIGCT